MQLRQQYFSQSIDEALLKYPASFPRIFEDLAKRANRIPRDRIGGRQKGTARLFYKRPLWSQKLVVYPPAILSRGPRSRWIPLLFFLLFFLFFFLPIPPWPIETRARRLWANARSTVHDLYPPFPSPRARFHLRLSHFDYLLREAYRLLIYSVLTNYDDLAGQRRYLFPLLRTSGVSLGGSATASEPVFRGEALVLSSPRGKETQRVIGRIHHSRIIGLLPIPTEKCQSVRGKN